ncbi:MAG TPA: hypothetical protein VLM18_03895 [Croceibacterium sp.]|nr:hypothetical protein [Croceibacterium sp.]
MQKFASYGVVLSLDIITAASFWWEGQRGIAAAVLLPALIIGGLGLLSTFEDE